MNKAITEGLALMPPAFAEGLDQWSRGNGTPGSDTYDGAPNAAFVPADADFGGCLEVQKTDTVQKLRFMGQTPVLPGCYLRIRARLKAVSGNLPSARIAAWAGTAGEVHLDGVPEIGPALAIDRYGEVVEISAIVGTGTRPGVDMPWGRAAIYGHFGLDLTGANGGVVRIDDIEIEDVTSVFLRGMLGFVDVRDFGALGDGVTDDSAAFEAADAAANGQRVIVPAGTYFLGNSVTFENRVSFEGTVTMPDGKILSLTKNFDLPAYIDAFGNEVLAFKKAFQALLNNSDHESLDMGGRRISVHEPIDMQAAVANRSEYAQRRHIRNGQFYVEPSANWDTQVRTSVASYNPNNPLELTNVQNIANIPVGALIEGGGVGREVYVREKNVAQQRITLSMPLYDAAGTQTFTFRRFKYVLDFSGFEKLSKFSMSDIEFLCRGRASGILLAPAGLIFHVKDCFFTAPADRAITSPGQGCQGMLVDRCQFLSNETAMRAQDRVSVGLNANANDVKLRNNRITQFRHFAILGGTSSIITGNHWFQGDDEPEGVRTAGLILTSSHNRATIAGNYIDNCSIEWSNEHDHEPEFASEYSFSGLNISDNVFQAIGVAPWFRFLVIKPHGAGHFINGLNMTGNIFRVIHGVIDRVDHVDTSFADLNYSRMRNITITGNMFNSVSQGIMNPAVILHEQNSAAATWVVDCAGPLPFGGYAQNVEAIVARSKIKNGANVARYHQPYVATEQGPERDRVKLHFPEPVEGVYSVSVRIDN
ncbi:right-handed parallel beta-helix repeat-containing protein [Lutimaribacter sp. EGI FJ00015]|uniref:Right-handed parallel beta-helix repeat-containing protein n=1 Tax=Lutimaribacter degradans TaxID=2945989 RepID=A0ACC5ZVD8_9RHOB|nr:glycosyl hydrolase family 28-related protein [Lutimaribacter sp. EGI FJ00013]MCM2561726.1 right-handed parallel beta-helix repeat-containing protein [Lutimaribacter sp. EGI FJ00013]MCO0612561.1 right-handed parallel beta-helix repeat-containing protein [Lutimaribacter sp. EGI FJ00015]MCO0635220.1 right-handed parallel beta-helix repeat-containing protein [Lutimaribacter sp. EGI FJ00014]